MSYRLAVLTHGRGDTLGATIESFLQRVSPAPSDVVIHSDGGTLGAHGLRMKVALSESYLQRGFCGATRELWREASSGDHQYVFWLEHDFGFDRDVDLRDLAGTLDEDERLAQMSLMRDPANAEEIAAGGLYELRRDGYRPMPGVVGGAFDPGVVWLEHRIYFTTTPSLMRREFMQANPWPDYPEQCEGRFGLDLVEAGYRFGVWGNGEPWVTHTGVRDGHGY